MSEIPVELKYTKDHEWIREQDDGNLQLGITDYAQVSVGDLVFVELPENDTAVDIVNADNLQHSLRLICCVRNKRHDLVLRPTRSVRRQNARSRRCLTIHPIGRECQA